MITKNENQYQYLNINKNMFAVKRNQNSGKTITMSVFYT